MSRDNRRRRLDERTDRLARRLTGFPIDRDTYYWACLRVSVAGHDFERKVARLDGAFKAAARQMDALTEVLRSTP